MASVNKVILIGNVTRDPEVKFTSKGSAVTDVALAINRNYTLDNGEKREEVTYVDVELWGRLAEIAGEYAKKGRPVYIEGRLRLDSWEDKASGQKRSRLKVVGESLQLLGGRPGSGGSPAHGGDSEFSEQPAPRRSAPAPSRTAAPAPPQDEDDDIPF